MVQPLPLESWVSKKNFTSLFTFMTLNVYGLPTLNFSLILCELHEVFYVIQINFNITYQDMVSDPTS